MPQDIVSLPNELLVNGTLYVKAQGRHSDLLTVRDVAELTGSGVHTIYDAIKAGELPARVPNGCVRGMRVRRSDAMAWMEETDV